VGIPSADLPHIFRRFYRVEKHHSQQEIKGTGLGLSIVKRAIEAHHGTVGVTSIPGKETKFLITLPLAH
jgi:two-component system phosphate regulon sensor histidine kinase PhoR